MSRGMGMPRGFHPKEDAEAAERRKEVYRRNPPRTGTGPMVQSVVIIEQSEWRKIERVIERARWMLRNAYEGKYRDDLIQLALDSSDLARKVAEMDGLCTDPECEAWGRHPQHEDGS